MFSQWDHLGALLGLTHSQLAIIQADNAYNSKRTEACCIAMLCKWLELEPSPTWGKLDDAIKLLTTGVLAGAGI